MDTYADAAEMVAAREVETVIARREPARMVEGVVTGTILGEAILNAFRRMAQQDASARRLVDPEICGPRTLPSMGDMTYRRLGTSGLAVSVVGIGCNNFSRRIDQDAAKAVVNAALECGITLFDTADVYGDPAGSRRSTWARRSRPTAAATT
jgi:hypothetical protein